MADGGGARSAFWCPYCSKEYLAPSKKLLLDHIRVVHAFDPDFFIQCSQSGCSRTFTNFRTYQNHQLQHKTNSGSEETVEENDSYSLEDSECSNSLMPLQTVTAAEMKMFAAKWILKTGETRKLTRSATQGIIEDTEQLVNFVAEVLESKLHSVLRSNKIDPDSISGLHEVFCGQTIKPLSGLTSFADQLNYYKQHFSFIVRFYSHYIAM